MYLERFKIVNPGMVLTSRTVQRLLLVAVMTAAKYLEDVSCLNTRWLYLSFRFQFHQYNPSFDKT